MQSKQKITIFFLFPLFLFSISACVASPLKTLTAIFTSTPTNTPQPTLTPTKTLLPTEISTSATTPNSDLIKDFAGIYRKVEYSYECSLEIGSNSTFQLLFQNTINGISLSANCVISYTDGKFLLTRTKVDTNAFIDYQCFPQTLVPIYWQERRYLFMKNDNSDGVFDEIVSLFCDDLKNGLEPKNNVDDINGIYFLRETDLTIKVIGFPVQVDGQLLCPSN